MNSNTKTIEKRRLIIVEIISALFILLFVYAALSKLEDFEKFQVEVGKSPLLNVFTGVVTLTIPFIEIVISVLLAIRRFQYLALYAAFTMMVIFSAYIVAILNFSSYIPCSCGGVLQNMTWNEHLIFNFGFFGLNILAILLYPIRIKNLSAVRGKA
jgi:hypothetical protein